MKQIQKTIVNDRLLSFCTNRIRIICRRCFPQRQLYSQKYVSDIQLSFLRSLQSTDPSIILLHIECAASYKCHNSHAFALLFMPFTNCLDNDCCLSYCCHKVAEARIISCASMPLHYPVSRQTTVCHRSVILERLIALSLRDYLFLCLRTTTAATR